MIDAKVILLSMIGTFSEAETRGLDIDQLECMAQNIYHESRGEYAPGMAAVGHVTMTRVKDGRFPSTICGVVKSATMRSDKPTIPVRNMCAFSWYCDEFPDEIRLYDSKNKAPLHLNIISYATAVTTAILVMNGTLVDNTNGATHYYNKNEASPNWANIYPKTAQIGDHDFHVREKGSLL